MRFPAALSIPVFVLSCFSAGALHGTEQRAARSEYERDESMVTLQEARTLIARREAGEDIKTLGPIGLPGYNWAREFQVRLGATAILVSCNLGGGILLFDATGRQTHFRRTWEIRSASFIDLDSDGTLELVTEERDGVGTGYQKWSYRIYFLNNAIRESWSAPSYSLEAIPPAYEEHIGFLWFGPHSDQLWYLVRDENSGRTSLSCFQYSGERFTPCPVPTSPGA